MREATELKKMNYTLLASGLVFTVFALSAVLSAMFLAADITSSLSVRATVQANDVASAEYIIEIVERNKDQVFRKSLANSLRNNPTITYKELENAVNIAAAESKKNNARKAIQSDASKSLAKFLQNN